MSKQLTEQEIKQIKDSVIASCVSKGIKPTVMTTIGDITNPLYIKCVQLGYDDAIKHATQGKLSLWFGKVNSFVQSQGGVTGLLQSVSSIAGQYNGKTPDMPNMYGNMPTTQFPPGYDAVTGKKRDNMGLWLFLIILLIVLIIATMIYFHRKSKVSVV
jgi:hypothetical protein